MFLQETSNSCHYSCLRCREHGFIKWLSREQHRELSEVMSPHPIVIPSKWGVSESMWANGWNTSNQLLILCSSIGVCLPIIHFVVSEAHTVRDQSRPRDSFGIPICDQLFGATRCLRHRIDVRPVRHDTVFPYMILSLLVSRLSNRCVLVRGDRVKTNPQVCWLGQGRWTPLPDVETFLYREHLQWPYLRTSCGKFFTAMMWLLRNRRWCISNCYHCDRWVCSW